MKKVRKRVYYEVGVGDADGISGFFTTRTLKGARRLKRENFKLAKVSGCSIVRVTRDLIE